MSILNIKRRELLQMIQDKQVTPESGLALLKKFDESFVRDDIAVIGMSCRCAGAENTSEFWQNVIEKKSLFYEKQTQDGSVFTCELPDKYCFDNEFFGITRIFQSLPAFFQKNILQKIRIFYKLFHFINLLAICKSICSVLRFKPLFFMDKTAIIPR